VHAFQPWTPTRTSLLFAQKKTALDEDEWTRRFLEYHGRATSAKAAALLATRKIITPRARTTPEQIVGHVNSAKIAMNTLSLPLPGGKLPDVEWANIVQEAIGQVDPDAFAFNATVHEIGGKDYLGVIVSEIGYRRTRRAENSARNDLFRAITEGDNPEPLRNLNYAKDGWRIVLEGEHEDALSVLRAANLWS
jgi:type I restriction enzyme M protein